MRILVTGGAGFIGSALVRRLLQTPAYTVCVLDCLTYAGSKKNLESVKDSANYLFSKIDIRDAESVRKLVGSFEPDWVFHLAAESHVDNSISGPGVFLETNIIGTYNLLGASLDYWSLLDSERRKRFKFVHVSTDEVFGDLSEAKEQIPFSEESQYLPNSPYSATKAASDHLVRAWQKTYGLPALITSCSNNFGPHQFEEKLIPVIIRKALSHQKIPIYGDGRQIRDWIFVDDHVEALETVALKGVAGQRYNVGGNCPVANVDLAELICDKLRKLAPQFGFGDFDYKSLIEFVADRLGHDALYLIDSGKIQRELGWTSRTQLDDGLDKTVRWYLENQIQ